MFRMKVIVLTVVLALLASAGLAETVLFVGTGKHAGHGGTVCVVDPASGAKLADLVALSRKGGPVPLDQPQGMALGPDGSLLLVSQDNGKVLRFDLATQEYLGPLADTGDDPTRITLHDGKLYLTLAGSRHDVVRLDPTSGEEIDVFIDGGGSEGEDALVSPAGLAFDGDGNAYVASSKNGQIRKYGPDGKFLAVFAEGLDRPAGIEFGPDGHLYVAEHGRGTVRRYDLGGKLVATFNLAPMVGRPMDVKFSPDGLLYVTDYDGPGAGGIGTGFDGVGHVARFDPNRGAESLKTLLATNYPNVLLFLPANSQLEKLLARARAERQQQEARLRHAQEVWKQPGADHPYYLMDKRVVESSNGVRLEVNPPRKAGVVLSQEKPWEAFYIHPISLVHHQGEYLLYYFVYPVEGRHYRHGMCLATSKDGLQWERPELGQVEYAGSKANNLVDMPYAPPSVNTDPKAPAEHRLLALGPDSQTPFGDPEYVLDSVALYTSADGRVWKQATGTLSPFTCDSTNQVFYDSTKKKYVVYLRACPGRRAAAYYEPPDIFQPWPVTPLESNPFAVYNTPKGPARYVSFKDELPLAIDTGVAQQAYNPNVVFIEGFYLAFPDIFRIFPGPGHPNKGRFPDSELYQWSNDGFVAPQLHISEDGKAFRAVGSRPYIDLGTGSELDCRQVRMVNGFIEHGDEIWQYYGGQRTGHTLQRGRRPRKGSDVMRVIQRKDGFAAMIAGPEAGEVVTTLLTCTSQYLQVNYDAGAWGELRVELLDAEGKPIPNFTLADSAPLIANEVYAPVLWSDRRDLTPLAGKQIRIRFQLKDARLFSFRFSKS